MEAFSTFLPDGTRLLDKISEKSFRRWFRIGLTLLALDLMRRGLTGCSTASWILQDALMTL